MKVVKAQHIESIIPIAMEWKDSCNAKDFGFSVDIKTCLESALDLMHGENSDLFLLVTDDGAVVGGMGILKFKGNMSEQEIACERFWYVCREFRGKGTMLLIKRAREWAKEKNCTHLMLNASNMASDLHDKICAFYERIGMTKFETSYVQEII